MIRIAYKTIYACIFFFLHKQLRNKKQRIEKLKDTIKKDEHERNMTSSNIHVRVRQIFFFPLRLFPFTFSFSQHCRAVTIRTSFSILLILACITRTTTASSSNSEAGLCMMTTIETRFRTACTTSRCTPSVFIHIGKYIYTLA